MMQSRLRPFGLFLRPSRAWLEVSSALSDSAWHFKAFRLTLELRARLVPSCSTSWLEEKRFWEQPVEPGLQLLMPALQQLLEEERQEIPQLLAVGRVEEGVGHWDAGDVRPTATGAVPGASCSGSGAAA